MWAAGWAAGAQDEASARRIFTPPLRDLARLIETLDGAVVAGAVDETEAVGLLRDALDGEGL